MWQFVCLFLYHSTSTWTEIKHVRYRKIKFPEESLSYPYFLEYFLIKLTFLSWKKIFCFPRMCIERHYYFNLLPIHFFPCNRNKSPNLRSVFSGGHASITLFYYFGSKKIVWTVWYSMTLARRIYVCLSGVARKRNNFWWSCFITLFYYLRQFFGLTYLDSI